MDLSLTSETIQFAGGPERTAPMTWGQKAIYSAILSYGAEAHYFNLMRAVDVPAGVGARQALAAVSALCARHDVLRTRFHETADGWVQHVHAGGEATVAVTRASEGGEPVARALATQLARHTFRHAEELPISFGLVVSDDGPTHVVLAVSHLAADGWAADLLKRDLVRLLDGDDLAAPAWTPVDQARYEADGPGAARGEAALTYWRRTLTTIPRSLFPPLVDAAERPDRFVKLRITSRALAVASTIVSARCGVSTGTVLLAAASIVLGRVVGRDRIALQLIASNRLDEKSRELVGPLAENALFALDVSPANVEGGFTTVARRTFAAGLNAYRHGQYDSLELDRFLADECEKDGAELGMGCYFNDMRIGKDWGIDVDSYRSVDEVRELMAQTETALVGSWAQQGSKYFVSVDETEGSCILFLLVDTELVPQDQVDKLLREMESVVVEAVAG